MNYSIDTCCYLRLTHLTIFTINSLKTLTCYENLLDPVENFRINSSVFNFTTMPSRMIQNNLQSETEITALYILFKFGKIMGLVPLQSKIKNLIFGTSTLIFHLIAMANFYSLILSHQKTSPAKSVQFILTNMIFYCHYGSMVISSFSVLCNRKNERKLIRNIMGFEEIVKTTTQNRKILYYHCVEILLYHAVIFGEKIIRVGNYLYFHPNDLQYLYGLLFNYLKFLIVLIIIFFLRMTKKRYQNFEENLVQIFRRSNENDPDFLLNQIGNLKEAYFLLVDSVEQINTLFGMQNFFIIIQCFLYALICFNTMVSAYFNELSGQYKSEMSMTEFHILESIISFVSIFTLSL